MKNILKIYKRDLKKIFTNSMAIILAVGIALLPSLYAWFNIFANWDPYGSTGNMQVAVVIEDEGFNYRNVEINVGETIKSNLEANDLIDWQFVTKDEALHGIESGVYYAGIEIPSGFSESLTSIVTSDFKQPQITYYANEKKNAIATKITDKVVQTVQQEVNESFVTTVINVVSSLIDLVADATKNGGNNVLGNLQSKIDTANAAISNVKETVGGFENIMKVSKTLKDTIDSETLKEALENSGELVDSGNEMAKLLQNSIGGITSSADTSLKKAASGLNEAADVLSGINTDVSEKTAEPVAKALAKLTRYNAVLETVRETLETVKSSLSLDLPALDKLIAKLDKHISRSNDIISSLTKIQSGATKAEVYRIADDIRSLSQNIDETRSDYKSKVQPVIERNLAALVDMLTVTGKLISDLNGELPTIKALAGSIDSTVESGADMVSSINSLLTNTQKQLAKLSDTIGGLKDSEVLNTIQNVAGKNSEQLGAFLACPVIVNTEKIYGIENYGSAMAPFYSTLAIWVGAMILIAVVKTAVKRKKEIGNLKIYQCYFGRMFTFLTFSVTQALIICLGDLYFLKIQCYHPFKFILAGLVAAVAFTVFIYSITFAFGDVGKAIGIIFLVIQIGGSGGTFPIDVTPQFFRTLNPYMPFTYVIEAMRECVCGTYANYYWIYLLKLCAYIAVGLIIGIGIKFIVKKPVRFFEKKVEETDLF